jgi:hypothetical protein
VNCSSSSLRAPARALAHLVKTAVHDEVLAPGEVLVDRGVLPRHADVAPNGVGIALHVDARHLGPTGIRAQQRGEDADGRGLAKRRSGRGRRTVPS